MLMVHAIQCFYVDFFAVKNGGQELEATAPANNLQALGRTFCPSSEELRNRSTSEYQSVAKVVLLSHKVDVGI